MKIDAQADVSNAAISEEDSASVMNAWSGLVIRLLTGGVIGPLIMASIGGLAAVITASCVDKLTEVGVTVWVVVLIIALGRAGTHTRTHLTPSPHTSTQLTTQLTHNIAQQNMT